MSVTQDQVTWFAHTFDQLAATSSGPCWASSTSRALP